MFKLLKTCNVVAAIFILSACSAKSDRAPAAKSFLDMTKAEQKVEIEKRVALLATKPYLEMTEADKKVEIEKYATLFNLQHMMDLGGSDRLNTKYYGDAEKDMIYGVGTYPRHVSAEQLKKAKKAIQRKEEEANFCGKPEMVHIAKLGIGYQLRMTDPSGKTIYESEACETVKSTTKLRGPSAAR